MFRNRVKIITALIALAVLSLVVINCVEAPFGPKPGPFQFPLAVGNSWDYAITLEQIFYDTSGYLASIDSITGSSRTTLESAVGLPENPQTYAYKTVWQLDMFNTREQEGFFVNEADGFYISVTKDGYWAGPPKLVPRQSYYEFKGIRANSLNELTDYFLNTGRQNTTLKPTDQLDSEDRPVRNWAYPLELGAEWLFRDAEDIYFYDIKKSIVSKEWVKVPAGTFLCYKLEWHWYSSNGGGLDSSIENYDYISEIGTVRRVLILKGLVHRDYEDHVLGLIDLVEDYSLTDYDVQ